MASKFFDNSLNRACGASDGKAGPARLSTASDDREQRIASLMWALGIVRRGVEWQEDSPILRIIEQVMAHEEERGDTLGPNVARMTLRDATPPAGLSCDMNSA